MIVPDKEPIISFSHIKKREGENLEVYERNNLNLYH
jgi:hypothetical protein